MAKVFKNPVKIENLDPEACRLIGGTIDREGKCKVKIVVDETTPKKVSIEPLEEDELTD